MSSEVFSAGVDEAGRGPLAGPVVVAAVVLDHRRPIQGLRDSKQLTPARRGQLADRIQQHALAVTIAVIDVATIDRINILQATMLGMRQALEALVRSLGRVPAEALIDGNQVPPDLPCKARALVGGDATSRVISAASIVAKTRRDQLMDDLDAQYPGYGFRSHRGYGTPEHLQALQARGPCPEHRRSFAPVRQQQLPFPPPLAQS